MTASGRFTSRGGPQASRNVGMTSLDLSRHSFETRSDVSRDWGSVFGASKRRLLSLQIGFSRLETKSPDTSRKSLETWIEVFGIFAMDFEDSEPCFVKLRGGFWRLRVGLWRRGTRSRDTARRSAETGNEDRDTAQRSSETCDDVSRHFAEVSGDVGRCVAILRGGHRSGRTAFRAGSRAASMSSCVGRVRDRTATEGCDR